MKKQQILLALLLSLFIFAGFSAQAQTKSGLRGPNDQNDPCELSVPVFSTKQYGKTIRFEILAHIAGTGVQFYYDFGDGNSILTQVDVISHNYSSYGDYMVNIVAISDCGNESYSRLVSVRPSLDPYNHSLNISAIE